MLERKYEGVQQRTTSFGQDSRSSDSSAAGPPAARLQVALTSHPSTLATVRSGSGAHALSTVLEVDGPPGNELDSDLSVQPANHASTPAAIPLCNRLSSTLVSHAPNVAPPSAPLLTRAPSEDRNTGCSAQSMRHSAYAAAAATAQGAARAAPEIAAQASSAVQEAASNAEAAALAAQASQTAAMKAKAQLLEKEAALAEVLKKVGVAESMLATLDFESDRKRAELSSVEVEVHCIRLQVAREAALQQERQVEALARRRQQERESALAVEAITAAQFERMAEQLAARHLRHSNGQLHTEQHHAEMVLAALNQQATISRDEYRALQSAVRGAQEKLVHVQSELRSVNAQLQREMLFLTELSRSSSDVGSASNHFSKAVAASREINREISRRLLVQAGSLSSGKHVATNSHLATGTLEGEAFLSKETTDASSSFSLALKPRTAALMGPPTMASSPDSVVASLFHLAERVAARTMAKEATKPVTPPPMQFATLAPVWPMLRHGAIFLKWSPAGAVPFLFWLQPPEQVSSPADSFAGILLAWRSPCTELSGAPSAQVLQMRNLHLLAGAADWLPLQPTSVPASLVAECGLSVRQAGHNSRAAHFLLAKDAEQRDIWLTSLQSICNALSTSNSVRRGEHEASQGALARARAANAVAGHQMYTRAVPDARVSSSDIRTTLAV